MANIDFEVGISRRDVSKTFVKGVAAGILLRGGFLLEVPGLIIKPTQVRSSKYWWPINDCIAERSGLPTMHAPGWILYQHDRLHQMIFGTDPKTFQWGQDKSYNVMYSQEEEYRNRRETAGFCSASTSGFLLEPELGNGRLFNGEVYTREWLEGFMVGDHVGDLRIPVPVTPELVVAAVQNDIPLMVEWPFDWYRAINKTDGVRAWVTAFGYPDIPVEINTIRRAFIVRRDDNSEAVDPEIKAIAIGGRIPGWNPEIRRMLMAGVPL